MAPATDSPRGSHTRPVRRSETTSSGPPASERLREVELPSEPEFDAAREALRQNVRRLNDQLFGPLDYAIVARA